MKNFILLLLLTPLFTYAQTEVKRVLQIYKTDSEVDSNLKANQSRYTFHFNAPNNINPPRYVRFSINGMESKAPLTNQEISITATPGKHIFQFFYNSEYYEVYSDSLAIKGKHHDTYTVQLYETPSGVIETIEKPVIYVYPEKTTDVSVKLNIHGEDPFFYPSYNDGWKFTAQPNGELDFGKNQYNYLFWEASIRSTLSQQQLSTGFFVEGENVVSFLEEKLSEVGLTSKEQADFITYWGPRLAKNDLNFVHFEFNESCDRYADIDISPMPDHINRIYMIWGVVSEKHAIEAQEMKPFNRNGFDVLEWGGQESHIDQRIVKLLK